MMQAKTPPRRFNTGAVLSGVAALVFVGLLMVAFVRAASPYVTIAEARKTPGDSLHLPGSVVKGSVANVPGAIQFTLVDTKGEQVRVRYPLQEPAGLREAIQVVAIGKLDGSQFIAHKLLVKCPSKYEGETKS